MLLTAGSSSFYTKNPTAISPFPSSLGPLYQNEVKCSTFDMEVIFHSHANKTHFHKKGCALGLIVKVRVFGTRKWPIKKSLLFNEIFYYCSFNLVCNLRWQLTMHVAFKPRCEIECFSYILIAV